MEKSESCSAATVTLKSMLARLEALEKEQVRVDQTKYESDWLNLSKPLYWRYTTLCHVWQLPQQPQAKERKQPNESFESTRLLFAIHIVLYD